MITGVQDVYYNVSDMTRSVAFYRNVLGLEIQSDNPYFTGFEVGWLRFGLHLADGDIPEVPRDEHGAHAGATVTFRVDDRDAAVARMKERDVKFLAETIDEPWGKLAVFTDPDGNVLKLMQPADGV